jgi:alanine racemase
LFLLLFSADELAQSQGTIIYEVVTAIAARVPRIASGGVHPDRDA